MYKGTNNPSVLGVRRDWSPGKSYGVSAQFWKTVSIYQLQNVGESMQAAEITQAKDV